MLTLTHCSLARNSRDVIIKHVHNEKHSDVITRVVAVFKVTGFWYWPILIEIDVHLGSAVNCRTIITRKWLYLTPTVSQPTEGRAGWDTIVTGYNIDSCFWTSCHNSNVVNFFGNILFRNLIHVSIYYTILLSHSKMYSLFSDKFHERW